MEFEGCGSSGAELNNCNLMADQPKFLLAPENASSLSPKEARELFQANKYYGPTSGFCLGYVQANLAVVPAHDADNFEEFCKRNSAPLPLLYRSLPGELVAPPLAENSDVRTDLPRYVIFSHGRQVQDMLDLSGFDWTGQVSFYLGCSFSFEQALLNAGINIRNVEEKTAVSVYMTDISCYDVNNKFTGTKMIVSMRPIKREHLQDVVTITSSYPKSHGAPIHIGDPRKIGIYDMKKTFFSDSTLTHNDEVSVFWACGVTGIQAIEALGPNLAFTHYPSSMFITDLHTESSYIEVSSQDDVPLVVDIAPLKMPYYASIASGRDLKQLKELEKIILDDPGGCGVQELREEDDFMKSVLTLSHAHSIAVIFGFPCNAGCQNLEETDGPPGALSIAQALQTLGKKVVIVSEERNKGLIESSIEILVSSGALKSKIKFLSCKDLILSKCEGFDCLVAIERTGLAKDGCHYTSKGRDVTEYLEPVDEVFLNAQNSSSIVTIGIGDRGNELGLGKIKEKVEKVMKNGAVLGCSVASDYVIMAGVSNWGGYAISVGLYLLANCPVHWRYVQHGINFEESRNWKLEQFLPTNEQTCMLLAHLNQLGVSDGLTKSLDQSVDGLCLQIHLDKLDQLRAVVKI